MTTPVRSWLGLARVTSAVHHQASNSVGLQPYVSIQAIRVATTHVGLPAQLHAAHCGQTASTTGFLGRCSAMVSANDRTGRAATRFQDPAPMATHNDEQVYVTGTKATSVRATRATLCPAWSVVVNGQAREVLLNSNSCIPVAP